MKLLAFPVLGNDQILMVMDYVIHVVGVSKEETLSVSFFQGSDPGILLMDHIVGLIKFSE